MKLAWFLIAGIGLSLAIFFPEEWRNLVDTVLEPVVQAFTKMVVEATDGV